MPITNTGTTFGQYERLAGTYDGLWDETGKVRPDWFSLFQSLQGLGKRELLNRHSEIQKLLRENGVTYNVYGDPAGLYRSWKLDALPLLINKNEWELIEKALIQRARLLNFILTDIYGRRDLIKNGSLPLDLIYNHNGFLRPCDGISLPGSSQLFTYAADIARDKEGRLWILNDRTQAPSGSGYALENRSVMSRVMPELFHGYETRKLNEFFNTMQQSLAAIAPKNIQNPRVVMLTPGPGNETYFEHTYLSAYLGYNLVQGEDLTVRDGFVWLKTIEGLERVDVILRRVDDSFCDPLELRPDSRLGVPGLLEAVRKGNVVVANPLGSSILENSGIMAFLPSLCKQYFKEDLILPSLNTWWCGQKNELNYVLEHLDTLSIKMIHRRDASRTISHGNLTTKQKEQLKNVILSKPYMYVAHEQLQLSTTPSFIEGNLDRRFAVLRCFLVAQDDGYMVMPGGLTRSSADRDLFRVSNQYGGISKDTWVLSPEFEKMIFNTFLPFENHMKEIPVLPSRTAENMFWAGRYATRAKITARFLREVLQKLNESKSSHEASSETLNILLTSLTHLTMTYPGFVGEESEEKFSNPEEEILNVILNKEDKGSLFSTIQFLKRTIFSVRNQWPSDTWHIIDAIDESWRKMEQSSAKNTSTLVRSTLEHTIDSLVTFLGLNLESIPRDYAYILLNKGRRIEKAFLLISQIRSTFIIPQPEHVEYALMEAILSTNMSLNIYRSRFRSYLRVEGFLELLLFDATNPSSLLHQLNNLNSRVALLPKKQTMGRLSKEEKYVMDAYGALQRTEASILKLVDPETRTRKELDELLSYISTQLSQISDVLIAEYFTHSELSQQLYRPSDENES